MLAWSFPNRPNCWWPASPPGAGQPETIRNHYATIWPDAWAAGAHLLRELSRFEAARYMHLSPAAIESAVRLLEQPLPDSLRGDALETGGGRIRK